MKRFTRGNPCPICGGYDAMPRGKAERCHGFLSDDGAYAHCARQEYAGRLMCNPKSSTYTHYLGGHCDCGVQHGAIKMRRSIPKTSRNIVARYGYEDASGKLLFEIVRCEPKSFYQRRPDGAGGWIYNLAGVERVLYRLPELLTADQGEVVFVPEGEKDVESIRNLGLVATTNPGGAGKWRKEYSETLRNRSVVIIPDNDQPGRDHAAQVASSLSGIASSVRIVNLSNLLAKGDVTDWIKAGGTGGALRELAAAEAEYHLNGQAEPLPALGEDRKVSHSKDGKAQNQPLTDLGNAERLVKRHRQDLRYYSAMKKWLVWDGKHWVVDDSGDVERRTKETVRAIYTDAAGENDDRHRLELAKWGKGSESRGRIAAMIELARNRTWHPDTSRRFGY